MHTPTHAGIGTDERRSGPVERRFLERDPASDRRLMSNGQQPSLNSEDVHARPPLDAGEAAPASENTSLLFERS